MQHDNGHLDRFSARPPTAEDKVELAKWVTMLEGAEALCNAQTGKLIALCNGEDLSDANAAYRHFLFGNGEDRVLNYERFIQGDPVGSQLIRNLLADFQYHTEIIGKHRTKFSVTSTLYAVGDGGIADYPKTSNWQKTLGAHFFWVSANLVISANANGRLRYQADLTMHVEDRYNFNPGSKDVATGIPDSANGRFELSGLGKQYMHYATLVRHVTWESGSSLGTKKVSGKTDRQRKPSDNRRLRNRI